MDFNRYREVLAERVGSLTRPFDDAEYDRRRRAVTQRMAAAGLDGLLVTDAADIGYLTGYNTLEVSVHTALLLTTGGNPPGQAVLQVPSIETGPAVTTARVDAVFGYRWEDANGAAEQMAGIIADLGLSGPIGTDNWGPALRTGFRDGLADALPDRPLIDASGLVDAVKIVKSDAEIALLRESARITEAGIAAAEQLIAPGVTDQQLAAAGSAAMINAGSEFMSLQPIVTAGWRSSVIHCNHQRHTVAGGDPVFIEFGSAYQRYTAPMMRTRVAGSVTDDMRRVADGIRDIHTTLIEHMRPGVSMDNAAAAAEAALAPLADRAFFSGVFGYTVGLQFPPSWVEGSGFIARGVEREFQTNMVFHLPLMLRIPGQWGIGMSNTVRVTEAGGEPLTHNDLRLTGTDHV
ncbi:aminopeptidase P family protein [Spiribacter aquaticus]|uniref:Aminopeptidase P family protein n=1 Tax=Spiribacter aquaticus TaxID=1935996 RepID=A0A557RNC8_9GAMM|nr:MULTISPECIES: Xaa-Pro peptidase family protein [Spiribacter]KAF0279717.1 Xaa-Pro aminopeptidase [Spiribacter roseus]TVO66690.1 aminopeptidase P family protein [Spiribacter aquaticus]